MRNLRSMLLPVAAMFFLAADNVGLGGGDPTLTKPLVAGARYRRKSDDAIVKAERYAETNSYVPGMSNAETGPDSPYVITKTGFREPVLLGDYVITESDGEHYYTYPASKFEQEYEAAPLDTSSPADLPAATHDVSAAEATPQPATDPLPTNTAFLQTQAGTLTPIGITAGSEPRIVDATVAASTDATDIASVASIAAPAQGTATLQDQLDAKDRQIAELDAWNKTASNAFSALDDYLHSVNPDLPEHYGMPVDGVRVTIEKLRAQSSPDLTKGLGQPGLHVPASPDAPTADEAAGALSTLLEHFPKLYAGILEPIKEMRHASTLTIAMKAKINEAIGVVEKRFSNI